MSLLNNSKLILWVGVVIFVAVGLLQVGVRPAEADITQALEEIINAIDPGAELPSNPGELSSRWNNLVGGDTSFAAADATVSLTVDTGYDISDITASLDANYGLTTDNSVQEATIGAGDTLIVAIPIQNLGNPASAIPFDLSHLIDGTDVQTDNFSVELWYADGEKVAADFDRNDVEFEEIANSAGEIEFTMGEQKTVFVLIKSEIDASDGTSVGSDFFVTNNAPRFDGTSGDNWNREDGPVETDDGMDTQELSFSVTVAGPNITIAKTQDYERILPGAEIVYTIGIENIGGASAANVIVADAIPQHTSFTGDFQADDADTVFFATDLADPDWTPQGDFVGDVADVRLIRWDWDEFAAAAESSVEFTVKID